MKSSATDFPSRLLKSGLFAILAAGVIAGLAGCASPTVASAMVAEPAVVHHRSSKAVFIGVSGGSATASTGASQISNEDFADALRASIERSGVLGAVVDERAAEVLLRAEIGVLTQPLMGFSMTVGLEVFYELVDRVSGESLLARNVSSEYTAAAGDALAGIRRLRLATEGAARENIDQLLVLISDLRLGEGD
jgi:hypothetical protein